MRKLILIPAFALLGACSSKHKVQDLDTSLENSETVTGYEKVGVKEGKMIVQKKSPMAEELRRLQWDVYGLEDRVYGNPRYGSLGLYGVLRKCRTELSDPDNGGDGKLLWQEPIERVIKEEETIEVGLDENQRLIQLSEEYLKDRTARFKEYQRILEDRRDEYEEKVLVCQTELKAKKQRNLSASAE